MKSLDCDSVLEQISDFIDEDVREEICNAIREHLDHCEDCAVRVDRVKKTIILYSKSKADVVIPVRVTADLAKAMQGVYAKAAD